MERTRTHSFSHKKLAAVKFGAILNMISYYLLHKRGYNTQNKGTYTRERVDEPLQEELKKTGIHIHRILKLLEVVHVFIFILYAAMFSSSDRKMQYKLGMLADGITTPPLIIFWIAYLHLPSG
ncbi:hypothetical protein ACJX0J_032502 [Zea mays]